MRMIKYTHACVRLEAGDRALVIDPGEFSETAQALDGADALLITHEHFDHLDVAAVLAAAQADTALRAWAPAAGADRSGSALTSIAADVEAERPG